MIIVGMESICALIKRAHTLRMEMPLCAEQTEDALSTQRKFRRVL